MTRLYKGALRKMQNLHFWTCNNADYENYMEESWKVRQDFDKIWNSKDTVAIDAMLDKYEFFIEEHFEPDFPLHKSRPHADNHGKVLNWTDEHIATDPIGYYSQDKLVSGEPTGVGFYEEYPNMTGGWVYTTHTSNEDFDYTDDINDYKPKIGQEDFRQKLDDQHK